MDEANAHAAAHGLRGFVASQPQWSLGQLNERPNSDKTMRFLTDSDAQWHTRSKLPVVPYSPTACGYFATGGQKSKGGFDNAVSQGRLARAQQLANEARPHAESDRAGMADESRLPGDPDRGNEERGAPGGRNWGDGDSTIG